MRELFAKVAGVAAKQHGRITTSQLREAGVDKSCASRWLREGRLHRVHHEVYAVGHPGRSLFGDYLAAALACGGVLSHAPAGHLLRLLRGAPPPAEVTVATLGGRRRPGIVIHRVRHLPAADVSAVHGIPVTTVPRTLLDLALRLTPEQLARACHEAWVHHRTRPHHVEACIARNPHKPGAAKLRTALDSDVTLSELEAGFLRLLRAHDLPHPRTNIDHLGDKVDCHWPQHDLTIELLSYRFHASRAAFEEDVARRRRSNHVAYTYGDVFERGGETVADLGARLQRAAERPRRVSRASARTASPSADRARARARGRPRR